jgi:hypothetical protein
LFIANWLSPGRHRPPENQIAVMDSNATATSMADLLEERFVDFAVGVIHVANRLDHTPRWPAYRRADHSVRDVGRSQLCRSPLGGESG